MRGWKRIVLRICLGLVVLLASLFALEALLLLFNDTVFRSSFYVFDPDMGFRVRPYARYGDQSANEFGFNDRDYPHSRRPGTYRILFLGDSFNWMGGQKENYTAVLEARFVPEFGEGTVEVISAGYSQTHTGEQLNLLRKYGLRYQPDLVVLGFFAGNDFFDADPNRLRIVVGGAMTDIFRERDFYTIFHGQPLVLRSRLLLYLKELWTTYQRRSRNGKRTMNERDIRWAGFFPGLLDALSLTNAKQGTDTRLTSEYLLSLWHRTQFFNPERYKNYRINVGFIEASLKDMDGLLRRKGVRFLVSVFPDEVQVDDQVRDSFIRHYGFDTDSWDWRRPQRLISEFCSRMETESYDLLPEFRAAKQSGAALYIPNNGHWNKAGNRLAAELFYSRLIVRVREQVKVRSGNGSGL